MSYLCKMCRPSVNKADELGKELTGLLNDHTAAHNWFKGECDSVLKEQARLLLEHVSEKIDKAKAAYKAALAKRQG